MMASFTMIRQRAVSMLISALLAACSSVLRVRALNDVPVAWTTLEAAYNPSLVEYGGKYISALKRTTFRKANHKVFWVNHLYVCVGPQGVLEGLRCQTYNPWLEPYLECEFDSDVRDGKTDVTGLGDIKVWVWPGRGLYTIFGRKPERTPGAGPYCTSKVVYDQWIAQIRPEQSAGPWRLQQPLRLYLTSSFKYPESPKYVMEKNWMPWVYHGEGGTETLYVTHMVNPHRILEVGVNGGCEVRYETNGRPDLFGPFAGHSIHGGPPVVWIDGKLARGGQPYYMGIMHHIELIEATESSSSARRRKKAKKLRLYRHFAYKFEAQPPFTITEVSDELPLTFFRHPNYPAKAHVAYVSGLFLGNNGTLYISYGAGDREARVMTMTVAEMEAMFTGRITFLPPATRMAV
ncbi:hypothetical protein VaNZ11_005180 [Volvox africanus]|uniref:DUF4185 domain-containing protein n=1 Tax=Volvox africanus TaxID=51714 RepID=A0ABQ5RY21_9CHLO|nr:hypothetical protein VaNZ11_005180 [Volvox africanus]